ncbi:ATP-binding cassette domain-containing protein [Geobacter sulfurreducens]|jgi:ATP-binding cassette subfamily C protein LapB|uniref:ABC transporter, ATP-binding/membrane protein n=1 Tax=Geobacter sulfurreducens (strain ATCC 51573 / DSM 12127 / PCA) TaxID=243231 RepID=Q74GG9_GEOSL|nr:ATP-binding cassette domain-containing protein [Geobacter sulfurreducens]AAR33611.1 ABC transporter, ATP-binding/membrane protein [Geobacter sulfurreducens PCA]ADI83111.1 ABC transporter, ATP-binding/membrane protein [Geobacter sulfurreducens KN400]AJY70005.1 ABC transporter ATP-binding protein [Geobacter sulfurreducens]QVW35545.1 ATP-binding cassette domain-containing protein [Geobacter sulfurreducens]UAC04368.1 ATP-binding cassette domain-containing protein [Geobacter sulfurreducens]
MRPQGHETVIFGENSLATPIEAPVLARLLLKIGLPVASGELEQACLTSQPEGVDVKPAERISRILLAVKQKNVKVAQLRWERLDRRHLPVLVLCNGRWQLAEQGEGETITLTAADGTSAHLNANDLTDTIVLWLKAERVEASAVELLQSNASRLLLAELLKEKRWLVEVFVATIIINLLAVATSLFSMQVYDRVVPTFAYSTLTAMVVGMGIMVLFDWVLKYLRARILDDVAKRVDMALSQKLFEHVVDLRLDRRPRSLGSLAAQMNGLETVRNFFSSTIVFALTDLPFGLMFIAIVASIGGQVSLVYITLVPVSLLLGWLAQRKLRLLARLEIQRGHERHGLLVDTLQGAETIQSSGSAWRFADTWRGITATMAGYSLKSKLISSLTTTTAATLGTVGYVGAIVVGVIQIEEGHLTTGGLIACTILGGKILGPLAQSVGILVQWQHVREAIEMVNRLLAMETSRPADKSLLVPDNLPDRLELDGVRFSYPATPVVRLQLGSLQFAAGDRVVLMGPNGCGKSTLLKVAAGLYKAGEGQVRLGGADIWELDPQVLMERVGYLPQDVHLFKGTLRSNIALAGGVGDSRLLEVVELLGIDKLAADNPRSMELEISEGGQGLSGGQRQLTALARIFMAQPRVWLLDEPTAALDMESEERVFKAIQNWTRPTDIILIATHRPRLLALANRLIVMRRGQIVADGAPNDVIQAMQAGPKTPHHSGAVHE